MKSSQFIKIIQEVISREVKKAVRTELRVALAEGLVIPTPTVKQPIKVSNSTTKQSSSKPQANNPIKKALKNDFSLYGPLAEILQETANNLTPGDFKNENEWPDMGTFTAEQAPMPPSSLMSSMDTDFDSNSEDLEGFDPGNKYIKDYSAVLKAADNHVNKNAV